MRQNWMVPVSAIMIGACAPGSPAIQDAPEPGPGITTSSTGAEVRLSRDSFVKEAVVEAPVNDVWRVLPMAWEDAMIPVASASSRSRTLESGAYRAPGNIVGKPLSDYFDCGYTMAGPRVTLWQVTVVVAGTVLPDSAGARVATRVEATARPRDGTSTGAVMCSSRGELERIIVGNVNVRLGR